MAKLVLVPDGFGGYTYAWEMPQQLQQHQPQQHPTSVIDRLLAESASRAEREKEAYKQRCEKMRATSARLDNQLSLLTKLVVDAQKQTMTLSRDMTTSPRETVGIISVGMEPNLNMNEGEAEKTNEMPMEPVDLQPAVPHIAAEKAEEVAKDEPQLTAEPQPIAKPLPMPLLSETEPKLLLIDAYTKEHMEEHAGNSLDDLNNLKLNVPLLQVVAQMPECVKEINGSMPKDGHQEEFEASHATLVEKEPPDKLRDSGRFNAPCDASQDRGLCVVNKEKEEQEQEQEK